MKLKLFSKKQNIKNVEVESNLYAIDGFLMNMGEGHMLKAYQDRHAMYDKFVPFLGEIAQEGTIIDIGANVGDTVAALIKHTKANIICVEPQNEYYSLLVENVSKFPVEYRNRIICKKAFIVMNSDDSYCIKTGNGTGVKCLSDVAESQSMTVLQLLSSLNIDLKEVSLIKTDTDGFDYECIMSLKDSLNDASIPIYWENTINSYDGLKNFDKMISKLKSYGYDDYFIFDNFGNFLLKANDMQLKQINEYLYRIEKNIGSRSFYYVDVISSKKDKIDLIEQAIAKYLNSFNLDMKKNDQDK